MKLYLAASSSELDRARLWRDRCVAAGIEVVSTWIDNVLKVGEANPSDASRRDRLRWSLGCIGEIRRADRFWLLAPQSPSFGAGFELSTAVEWIDEPGRNVIISGDTKRSIFCALGREYATDEEAFAAIVAEATPSDQRVTLLEVE